MKLLRWCKANAMPVIAVLAAAVTAVFVPPDAAYLGYYDVKTLSCLLCVLAVVGALRRVGLFPLLAQRLVQVFHTTRGAVTALVGITLVGSIQSACKRPSHCREKISKSDCCSSRNRRNYAFLCKGGNEMKGLLTKDFLTIKKKYGLPRVIMDIAIIIALMFILEKSGTIYISFLLIPIEIMSMIISLTTCDEQWKWGKYAVSLPVSKKQIV